MLHILLTGGMIPLMICTYSNFNSREQDVLGVNILFGGIKLLPLTNELFTYTYLSRCFRCQHVIKTAGVAKTAESPDDESKKPDVNEAPDSSELENQDHDAHSEVVPYSNSGVSTSGAM
jgi:hypothetical protein